MEQHGAKPASLSVLLAEDNLVNQRVASALLGKIGHKVTVCSNGQEALQAVIEGTFDLVLMDIQMPVMDGLAATAAIRALPDPRKSQIPIMAISANVRDGDIALYRAQGITEVLTKPLRPDRLRTLLETCETRELPSESLLDMTQIAALRDALPPAKLVELFGIARKSLAETHEALVAGWRGHDLARIKSASHRLAGVARNFGCIALGDCAAAVENAVSQGSDGAESEEKLNRLMIDSLAALPGGL